MSDSNNSKTKKVIIDIITFFIVGLIFFAIKQL